MDNIEGVPGGGEKFEDRDQYKALIQKFKEQVFSDLDKAEKAIQEMVNFQKANPEIINFELWQDLIGSTPPEGLVFDSSERKVRDFVDGLVEKYIAK